jgi:hypothetical protein
MLHPDFSCWSAAKADLDLDPPKAQSFLETAESPWDAVHGIFVLGPSSSTVAVFAWCVSTGSRHRWCFFFFDFWIVVYNMYLELWSARSGMLPAFAPTFQLLVFWKVRYIRAERLWKWSNKPDQKPWSESSLMFHIDMCSISFGNVIQNSILKTKTRMGPPKPVWCSGPWNWGDSCMTTHNDLTIDHGYWED